MAAFVSRDVRVVLLTALISREVSRVYRFIVSRRRFIVSRRIQKKTRESESFVTGDPGQINVVIHCKKGLVKKIQVQKFNLLFLTVDWEGQQVGC